MTFNQYLSSVKSDAYRYTGSHAVWPAVKCMLSIPGLKYTLLLRSAAYLKEKGVWGLPVYGAIRALLHRYTYKYGISIPYNAHIGMGLYIGHFGGIIVNWQARLGNNCNINHEVTIGATYGGKYPGVPIIGDNVYLGPGSKIVGGIQIGHNVAIGANAVVVEPIPDNAVVGGIPAHILSFKGSSTYVINRWEECAKGPALEVTAPER